MIALLDTSVVLRKLFAEPGSLREWEQVERAYASRVLLIELGRVFDRVRLAGEVDDGQVEQLRGDARRLLRTVDVVALSERILLRATGPMPTALGTLDAIHLATALELAPEHGGALVLTTHDRQLARAARASGLEVCGA